jgi:hypothetical protein
VVVNRESKQNYLDSCSVFLLKFPDAVPGLPVVMTLDKMYWIDLHGVCGQENYCNGSQGSPGASFGVAENK